MNAFFKRLTDWRPQFLSLLRIVTTLLFLEHATQKLFGFPGFSMPPGGTSSRWRSPRPVALVTLCVTALWFAFRY